eukprot:GHVP01035160.1.p1 GENE.GHVP01035160.1~~GHVP01035160.1.p1  ORF type:complete len:409 (+),score=89.71 GHVP01035160.1:22-1248(+)
MHKDLSKLNSSINSARTPRTSFTSSRPTASLLPPRHKKNEKISSTIPLFHPKTSPDKMETPKLNAGVLIPSIEDQKIPSLTVSNEKKPPEDNKPDEELNKYFFCDSNSTVADKHDEEDPGDQNIQGDSGSAISRSSDTQQPSPLTLQEELYLLKNKSRSTIKNLKLRFQQEKDELVALNENLRSELQSFQPYLNELREIRQRDMLSFYEALQTELRDLRDQLASKEAELSKGRILIQENKHDVETLKKSHCQEIQKFLDNEKRLKSDIDFQESKVRSEEKINLATQEALRNARNEITRLKEITTKIPTLEKKIQDAKRQSSLPNDSDSSAILKKSETPRTKRQKALEKTPTASKRKEFYPAVASPPEEMKLSHEVSRRCLQFLSSYGWAILFIMWVGVVVHFGTLVTC